MIISMIRGRVPAYFLVLLGLLSSSISIADIQVLDDLGRKLSFAKPVQRIISLAPHNTENLFSAGAGSRIVGTVDHSDYPLSAQAIPRVGNYKQFNIEAILALKPDLIIAWASGNNRASVQRLLDLGLSVFYSEPTSYELIISNIERFAQLSGQSVKTQVEITAMLDTLASLRKQYSEQTPVKVFYQVWDQPLITLSSKHAVSRAIEICGGVNIFADEATIAPRINIEGIIAKNPQLILLAGHDPMQAQLWQQKWIQWPVISAVEKHQLKAINADVVNRPTRRFIDGTKDICKLIDEARRA